MYTRCVKKKHLQNVYIVMLVLNTNCSMNSFLFVSNWKKILSMLYWFNVYTYFFYSIRKPMLSLDSLRKIQCLWKDSQVLIMIRSEEIHQIVHFGQVSLFIYYSVSFTWVSRNNFFLKIKDWIMHNWKIWFEKFFLPDSLCFKEGTGETQIIRLISSLLGVTSCEYYKFISKCN